MERHFHLSIRTQERHAPYLLRERDSVGRAPRSSYPSKGHFHSIVCAVSLAAAALVVSVGGLEKAVEEKVAAIA